MTPPRLEVIPVLHATDGQLVGPDAEPIDASLREVARRFSREWEGLYLVDLDGLRRNKPDVELIQELGGRVHLWVDAGSRTHEDVMDLIIAGAEQVTVRYHTADAEEVLEESVRISENVALGMEFRNQELVQNKAWPATPPELNALADRLHIPLVAIDHGRAGTRTGVDRSVAWHARNHGPGGYFAGGIASQRDLDVLQDLGYKGGLVSTALLEGANLDGRAWEGPASLRDADEDEQPSSGTGTGTDLDPMGGIF